MIELREEPGQTGPPSLRKAVFRCNCGRETVARRSSVRSGNTKSCGCSRRSRRSRGGPSKSRAYKTWNDMIRRTSNPANKDYPPLRWLWNQSLQAVADVRQLPC